jgi:uncharacterized protein (TIGR02231 family)
MMIVLALASHLAVLGAGPGAVAGAAPATRITEVTVFPDGARVVRRVEGRCEELREARLEALPAAADRSSLQVRVRDGATGAAVTMSAGEEEGGAVARREAAEAALQAARGAAEAAREEQARARAALEATDQFRQTAFAQVSREMLAPAPDPAAWRATLAAVLDARLESSAALTAATARRREADVAVQRAAEAVAAAGATPTAVPELNVACAPGARVALDVSYEVSQAGWRPAHELHLSSGGAQARQGRWVPGATIAQTTGEDWASALVTVATARAAAVATPPVLAPLRLRAERDPALAPVLVDHWEDVERLEARVESIGNSAPPTAGPAVQVRGVEPLTVPADGRGVRLAGLPMDVPITIGVRAAPKLAAAAYRVVSVTNTAPFPFIAGPVDVFVDGGFVVRQPIRHVPAGDRFELTAGAVESLVVAREVVEEQTREVGLLGRTHVRRFAYQFTVSNRGPRPMEVDLMDQVPVSAFASVRVQVDGTTPGHTTDEEGRITWRLALRPGERRAVDLAFRVELPAALAP